MYVPDFPNYFRHTPKWPISLGHDYHELIEEQPPRHLKSKTKL
jgi:hypothetical protein